MRTVTLAAVAAVLLCGCGGGGDDAAPAAPPPPPPGAVVPPPTGPTFTPGVYAASSEFASQCASPRTGTDPQTGAAWRDRPGSALLEKHWLRAWTQELYLWYAEVPDRDPALTPSVLDYFELLKTPVLTASGQPKDRFHYTWNTAEYRSFVGSGSQVGYGIGWVLERAVPPRRLVISHVEPDSPAAAQGLGRGMEVLTIDGVDFVNDNTSAGVDTLVRGMEPSVTGESHTFGLRERGGAMRTVVLASAKVTTDPVPVARVLPGKIGYLLFNDHIATAERALAEAIVALRDGGAEELVLDLRYNGGGFLDIASELGFMVGGARVAGKTFELQQFNSRHPTHNPVIGGAIEPVPFHDRSQGFSLASGQPLPTLGLDRVVVLTGEGTCSASEAIINGLRGAGVEVIQVGGTTCGKPYGFYPFDNCGTTYFSIQFRNVNALGFGDYADGFAPARAVGDPRANLPGCAAADDYGHDLGDPAERLLGAAIAWLQTGSCPVGLSLSDAGPRPSAALAGESGGRAVPVPKAPWRTDRLHETPGEM